MSLPRKILAKLIVHGTINYFEKVLIINNLTSTPPGRDGE